MEGDELTRNVYGHCWWDWPTVSQTETLSEYCRGLLSLRGPTGAGRPDGRRAGRDRDATHGHPSRPETPFMLYSI